MKGFSLDQGEADRCLFIVTNLLSMPTGDMPICSRI